MNKYLAELRHPDDPHPAAIRLSVWIQLRRAVEDVRIVPAEISDEHQELAARHGVQRVGRLLAVWGMLSAAEQNAISSANFETALTRSAPNFTEVDHSEVIPATPAAATVEAVREPKWSFATGIADIIMPRVPALIPVKY